VAALRIEQRRERLELENHPLTVIPAKVGIHLLLVPSWTLNT